MNAVKIRIFTCVFFDYFFRKLAMSQLQMDDRRRKQMNYEYSRTGPKPADEEDDS